MSCSRSIVESCEAADGILVVPTLDMTVDWTIVDEIRLYRWVAEFKPAGINKHFHMLCIVERMNYPERYPVTLLQKEAVRPGKLFTAEEIWDKLGAAYDLAEIDKLEDQEIEVKPRSDDSDGELTMLERRQRLRQVRDFELPWEEYGDLILKNARNGVDEDVQENTEDEDTALSTPTASEREDSQGAADHRRSTRIRKSSRLHKHSGDEGESSNESSDNEAHESSDGKSKEGSEELISREEAVEDDEEPVKDGDQPLAKRTRHSSQTRTTSETSPKRKKRATEQPGSANPTAPRRVSSRLRNRKQ